MNRILQESLKDLDEIINCINVGIYITDGDGNTLTLNEESARTGGLTRRDVIGVNMRELTEKGFVKESGTLKALESGKTESFVQDLGDGGQIFITSKPFYRDGKIEFVVCTERDITETKLLERLLEQKEQVTRQYELELEYIRRKNMEIQGDAVAVSESMRGLIKRVMKIARRNTTVLLTGESGTGKEIFANMIYKNSERVNKPFIKVNCAAIPENLLEAEFFGYERGAFTGADKRGKIGFFEMASGGTLFLDEIGEMPIHMQSKLLRAIQEREIRRIGGERVIPIDIRLIAATNTDLPKAIEEGRFREDLYYRLNIVPVDIPPLRRRKEDIRALALYFTDVFCREYKTEKVLSDEAAQMLSEYDWPGNVRELKNIIERAVVSFDGMEVTGFQVRYLLGGAQGENSSCFEEGRCLKELLESYEKEILTQMMRRYGKASALCKKLHVNKSTMSRKLKKYGISGSP